MVLRSMINPTAFIRVRHEAGYPKEVFEMAKKCEPNICRFPDHKDRCYCGRYDLKKIKQIREAAYKLAMETNEEAMKIRDLCNAMLDYPRPDEDGAL